MNRILILLLIATAANGQKGFFSKFFCSRISEDDCNLDPPEPECGANGVTYKNRCFYTIARCKGVDTNIVHKGSCTPTSGNQTQPGFTGDQAALDYLCAQLSHESCPTTVDNVCASDGKIYSNLCEYEKHKCTHRDLHVQSLDACNSN